MQRLLERAEELSGFEYDISSYADIVQAIHVIQEDMKITGTTAKEAGTTISGALSAAGAAWSNLVTGISDGNADISQLIDDFVTTITGDGSDTNLGVFGTLIPTVEKALNGMGDLIKKLVPQAVNLIPGLIQNTLPSLINAAGSIVGAIGTGIMENAPMLITTALELIVKLVNYFAESAPKMVETSLKIIYTLMDGLIANADKLIAAATDIIVTLAEMLTNPEEIQRMVDTALTLLLAIADGLITATPQLLGAVGTIITNLGTYFSGVGEKLGDFMWDITEKALETGKNFVDNILAGVQEKWEGFKNWVLTAWEEITSNFDLSKIGEKAVGTLSEGFSAIKNAGEGFADLIGLDGSLGFDSNEGSSRNGRREVGSMNVTYNITTPITDTDTLDKSAQRFWNDYAYGH